MLVEDGIRVLRALDPDVPEVVLDASNETMLQGVVVYWVGEPGRGCPVRATGTGQQPAGGWCGASSRIVCKKMTRIRPMLAIG